MDLPVGKNLVDHVMAVLPPFIIDKPVSFNPDRDLNFKVLWDYMVHGKGIDPAILQLIQHYKILYFLRSPNCTEWYHWTSILFVTKNKT